MTEIPAEKYQKNTILFGTLSALFGVMAVGGIGGSLALAETYGASMAASSIITALIGWGTAGLSVFFGVAAIHQNRKLQNLHQLPSEAATETSIIEIIPPESSNMQPFQMSVNDQPAVVPRQLYDLTA